MIFNDDLLFIHVPKTAGIALSRYLLRKLPGPIYYAVPNGHGKDAPRHVTVIEGRRHETLEQAQQVLKTMGRSLASFEVIISAIRNPYAIEVSRYHYLRLGHPWDKGKAQTIALAGDFTNFAINAPFLGQMPAKIEAFFTYQGNYPQNLVIVHQENLESQLAPVLAPYDLGPISLPRANKTKHRDYLSYITPAAEEGIYKKFQWVFDENFYERILP